MGYQRRVHGIFSILYIIIRLIFMKVLLRLTHPISLGIILIFYSLLIGVATITLRTPWFFYLLVLVFLGGVIIFIIYIRIFFINNYNYTLKSSFNTRILINLYEYSNRRISIFLITYLLITMVCVVKLVKFERGPLVGRL